MISRPPIRIGIIGLGRIGLEVYIQELMKLPAWYEIVAVCDFDKQRRDIHLVRNPRCHSYRRVEDIATDPMVEMFLVVTRTDTHCSDVMQLLRTGKWVVVEPPPFVMPDEINRLRAEVVKTGNKLLINQRLRFTNVSRFITEFLKKPHELTGLYGFKISDGFYERRDDWMAVRRCNGGAVYSYGVHQIDFALTFFNPSPNTILSDVRRVAALGDAEDSYIVYMRNSSNFFCQCVFSGGQVSSSPYFVLHAANGELVIDTPTSTIAKLKWFDPSKLKRRRASVRQPGLSCEQEPEFIPWQEASLVIPSETSDGANAWDAIYKAVRENIPFPVTLEQSTEVVKILYKIKRDSIFA